MRKMIWAVKEADQLREMMHACRDAILYFTQKRRGPANPPAFWRLFVLLEKTILQWMKCAYEAVGVLSFHNNVVW